MGKTIAGQLQRLSDGHRMPLAKLAELRTELGEKYEKAADLVSDLENAKDAMDGYAAQLLDPETSRNERRDLWSFLSVAAGEAMEAVNAIEAWQAAVQTGKEPAPWPG